MKDQRPRLSIVALVVDTRGRVLMGRRRHGPSKGKLVMPGGGVEMGETIDETLRRETYEETKVRVRADIKAGPIDVAEMPGKKAHRICLVYPATTDGVVQTSIYGDTDELYEVGYYLLDSPVTLSWMQNWVKASLTRIGLIE